MPLGVEVHQLDPNKNGFTRRILFTVDQQVTDFMEVDWENKSQKMFVLDCIDEFIRTGKINNGGSL